MKQLYVGLGHKQCNTLLLLIVLVYQLSPYTMCLEVFILPAKIDPLLSFSLGRYQGLPASPMARGTLFSWWTNGTVPSIIEYSSVVSGQGLTQRFCTMCMGAPIVQVLSSEVTGRPLPADTSRAKVL